MSEDELGSIGYLAAEFPAGRITEEDAAILLDAVDRRIIRVLDLEFVTKDADGSVRRLELHELENPDGVDVGVWSGAYSGVLDDSDMAEIGSSIEPGSVAGIVIYENLWTLDLDAVLHSHGARLIADGRIEPEELVAALEQTEQR
ncbi:MAG: hypothetical protein JO120_07910 [Solirubrobacterales bacterium]|nr:hypothetical protein [Solirubrobacterales bacterium]